MSSIRRWPNDVANLEIEIVDPEDDGSSPPTPQLLLARSAARDVLNAPSPSPAPSDERGAGDDC